MPLIISRRAIKSLKYFNYVWLLDSRMSMSVIPSYQDGTHVTDQENRGPLESEGAWDVQQHVIIQSVQKEGKC